MSARHFNRLSPYAKTKLNFIILDFERSIRECERKKVAKEYELHDLCAARDRMEIRVAELVTAQNWLAMVFRNIYWRWLDLRNPVADWLQKRRRVSKANP